MGQESGNSRFSIVQQSHARVVHAALKADQGLDLSLFEGSYRYCFDPTAAEEILPPGGWIFLWLPPLQYFSGVLQQFTIATALCTVDTERMVERFKRGLGKVEDAVLSRPPGKLVKFETSLALESAAGALEDCLTVSVALPDSMLVVAKGWPEVGQRSLIDPLVIPLARFHAECGFGIVDVRLAGGGRGATTSIAHIKRLLRAVMGRNRYHASTLAENDYPEVRVLCRLIAWAVGRYYNRGEDQWLKLLGAVGN